jgi:hypothetical protein
VHLVMTTNEGLTIGFGDHTERHEGIILLVECLQQLTTHIVPVKTQVSNVGIGGEVTPLLTQP